MSIRAAAPPLLLGLLLFGSNGCLTPGGQSPEGARGPEEALDLPDPVLRLPELPPGGDALDRVIAWIPGEKPVDCPGLLTQALSDQPAVGRPGSWSARPLFGASPSHESLSRYCLFHREPTGAAREIVALRDAVAALVPSVEDGGPPRVREDRMVVSPSGLGTVLDAVTLSEALGGTLTVVPNDDHDVRLSLFDTSPTWTLGFERDGERSAGPSPQNSVHGPAILNLTEKLLCSGGACAATVRQRLAMPLRMDGGRLVEDTARGGHFGSIAQLAEAVEAETLTAGCGATDESCRWILVLPLGFGDWTVEASGPPARWDHDVKALCDALLAAQDRGGLVVAPVGNAAGFTGPHRDKPLLPGAWGLGTAPGTANACLRPGPNGPSLLRVVPVGAVDVDKELVEVSRDGAVPPFLAYGAHAHAPDSPHTGPTVHLNGTSVASAVVGAALALRADGTGSAPPTLVDDLYGAANLAAGITRDAVFKDHDVGSHPDTRIVKACQSLPTCPLPGVAVTASCCGPRAAGVLTAATPDSVPPEAWQTTATTACGRTSFSKKAGDALPPGAVNPACPEEQLPGPAENPWVHPQPTVPHCGTCPLEVGNELVRVHADSGFPLDSEYPTVHVLAGGRIHSFQVATTGIDWTQDNKWAVEGVSRFGRVSGARLTALARGVVWETELVVLP